MQQERCGKTKLGKPERSIHTGLAGKDQPHGDLNQVVLEGGDGAWSSHTASMQGHQRRQRR